VLKVDKVPRLAKATGGVAEDVSVYGLWVHDAGGVAGDGSIHDCRWIDLALERLQKQGAQMAMSVPAFSANAVGKGNLELRTV
jgi:hypothetical protein